MSEATDLPIVPQPPYIYFIWSINMTRNLKWLAYVWSSVKWIANKWTTLLTDSSNRQRTFLTKYWKSTRNKIDLDGAHFLTPWDKMYFSSRMMTTMFFDYLMSDRVPNLGYQSIFWLTTIDHATVCCKQFWQYGQRCHWLSGWVICCIGILDSNLDMDIFF